MHTILYNFFSLHFFLSLTHFLLSCHYSTHNTFYYSKYRTFFFTHISFLNTALLLFAHPSTSYTPVSSTYRYHPSHISFPCLIPSTSYTLSCLFPLSDPISHFLYPLLAHCPTSYSHITHLFISYQFPTSYTLLLILFTFPHSFTIANTNTKFFIPSPIIFLLLLYSSHILLLLSSYFLSSNHSLLP